MEISRFWWQVTNVCGKHATSGFKLSPVMHPFHKTLRMEATGFSETLATSYLCGLIFQKRVIFNTVDIWHPTTPCAPDISITDKYSSNRATNTHWRLFGSG
jgi:hypothetical protein